MDRLWADGPPTRTYTPTPLRDERPAEPRDDDRGGVPPRRTDGAGAGTPPPRAAVEAGRAGWRRSGAAPSPPRS